jgi:tRNA G26 N,N-dimethylase Trm1
MITASEAKKISEAQEGVQKEIDSTLKRIESDIRRVADFGETVLFSSFSEISQFTMDQVVSTLKSLGYTITRKEDATRIFKISWKDFPDEEVYEDHEQLVKDNNSYNDALDDYYPVDEGDK